MAPVFEKSEEIKGIVDTLISKRQDLFEEIDPKMIECALRTDKAAPPNQEWVLKIKGVRGEMTALTETKYIIYGYESRWNGIVGPEKKYALVAYALKQIDYPTKSELQKLSTKGKDFEWGKLVKPDLKSFKSFIMAFGVDWEESSALPDITEDQDIYI